jgi:MFS transporter, MFS domain-containing protein family, molybdate-anion transporter
MKIVSVVVVIITTCSALLSSGIAASFTVQRTATKFSLSRCALPRLPKLHRSNTQNELNSKVIFTRGGSIKSNIPNDSIKLLLEKPTGLFNCVLVGLAGVIMLMKQWPIRSCNGEKEDSPKPMEMRKLQVRFLTVFWLIRAADWLQGPYFHEVYSSKQLNGVPFAHDLVSKLFLIGFATTGICGPFMGHFVDRVGRKAGTIAFTILYALGALCTRSEHLSVLALGRLSSGLGTSLLFSAPEAWLVGEHRQGQFDGKWLGETFAWAYAGDAAVAVLAGLLAGAVAKVGGPTAPFLVSIAFLAAGAVLAVSTWRENKGVVAHMAQMTGNSAVRGAASVESEEVVPVVVVNKDEGGGAANATHALFKILMSLVTDKRILLLGTAQAMFEAAMYIFVLQWPPLMKRAIQSSTAFGNNAAVPYGTIFSCFMASCMVGSTVFSLIQNNGVTSAIPVEKLATAMLAVASLTLGTAAAAAAASVTQTPVPLPVPVLGVSNPLTMMLSALLVFEACVGFYFPSFGMLRSKHIPDSCRSLAVTLFGVPLNLLVVAVFLSLKQLGAQGALLVASSFLAVATIAMSVLDKQGAGYNEKKEVLRPFI